MNESCACEAHAEVVSIPGAVLFVVTALLTVGAFAMLSLPGVTGIQQTVVWLLAVIAMAYALDALTERMRLIGRILVVDSALSREKRFVLDELRDLDLYFEGYNLTPGFQSVIARFQDGHTERIPLGPCWQRHKLVQFLDSIHDALALQVSVRTKL